MKIETKFDIGNKVWIITRKARHNKCSECGGEVGRSVSWVVMDKPGKVEGWWIKRCLDKYEDYNQTMYYCGVETPCFEEYIFTTKKEAEAACEKFNKEKK